MLLVLPLFLGSSTPAAAAVRVVDCHAGPFTDITSAVLASVDGDVIVVRPCIYRETVSIPSFRDVSLVAAEVATEVGAPATGVGALPDSAVVIDGSGQPGDCVSINGATSLTITGFTIKNCEGHGIAVDNATQVNITGNRIQGAALSGVRVGRNAITVSVTGNAIGVNGWNGIFADSRHVVIADNRVAFNGSTGITVFSPTGAMVVNNEVVGNGFSPTYLNNGNGIWVYGGVAQQILRNTSRQNAAEGILLDGTDGATVVGNDTQGSGVVDGGTGSTLFNNL